MSQPDKTSVASQFGAGVQATKAKGSRSTRKTMILLRTRRGGGEGEKGGTRK
jgi:hypothetical protein